MTLDSQIFGARGPAPLWSRTRRLAAGLAVLASAVSITGTAQAQRVRDNPLTSIDSTRKDGSVVSVPLKRPANAFGLFAGEDFACATWRSSGELTGGTANQGGPAPFNQSGGCTNTFRYGGGSGNGWFFFEMGLIGGAPPSEWRKIRAVYPNARNMLGSPGYAAFWHFTVSTPTRIVVGPADGQFGKVFSGLTIAFDGSCRDDILHQREGFSLLPQKDCPGTWGSEGFKGKPVVPDSVWRNRFVAGSNTFSWDDFRIPATQLDPANTLGTQSFYGYMSDYFREVKLRYGSVVLGGAGAPSEQGYPLGLEMRLDGWQFGTPAVRNTEFYELTIVNKSAEVYGAGVDYDSLYYGVAPGMVTNGQNGSWYFDMGRSTVFMTGHNVSNQCSGTLPKRYAGQTAGCPSTTTRFGAGIFAMTWLKSPLGDLRNKLFTQPSSPYYAPTNPAAGDTITFNHAKQGSFGNWNAQFSTRAAFGMVSSTEDNYLDGRTPADLGAATYLARFQPEEFSGVLPDASDAKFNKFVPGNTINPKTGLPFGKWDYNHDGVQDSISVAGCGKQGCHALWSDTVAGGYRNSFGNVGNSITAGPFKLKANDTTQFLWAFTWAADTVEMERRMDGLLNSYNTNYQGPSAFTFPNITAGVSYSVQSAEYIDSTTFGDPSATIGALVTLRLPQISPIDPFFLRAIAKIRQDSINNVGTVRRVLRLNPGLLDKLTARANDNLAAVYIFKSCDGGATFTTTTGNSGTCTARPSATVDGGAIAFPYQPWARVNYTNGIPASGTISETVQAGRTYIYSFITRTRGFRDIRVVDSTSAGFITTDVQNTLGITADTINSAFAASGPAALTVYAPITEVSGRKFARVDTSTISGKATQDVLYGAVQNDVTGSTRLVYANQFIIRKTIDTLTSAATTTVNARWVLPAAATSPTGAVTTNFVAREQTFTVNRNIPVRAGTAVLAGTQRSLAGSSRVLVDTVNVAAGNTGFVWVTSDNRPIYVTDNQYGGNYIVDEFSSPLYPGYVARSRDSSNSATGFRQEVIPSGTVRDRNFVLRAPGDTLQANARQFAPTIQNILTTVKRARGGSYTLTWLSDPFGPGSPFVLDPPQDLQAKVTASLTEVARLSTTITDTTSRIGAMVGATAARPLVRVHVPFTMTFTDAETGATEPVRFAMLRRQGNGSTRLLGSGNDTLRVNVPDTLWLPGDTLYAIQKIARDSSVTVNGTRVVVVAPETVAGVAGFRPIQVTVDSIGLNKFVNQCVTGAVSVGVRANAFDQTTCNPLVINTRGATQAGGYLPVAAGWTQTFELTRTFDPRSAVLLTATPFQTGNVLTTANLDRVSVVPNPYIVRSDLDELSGRTPTSRIYFTGVPDQGVLRVYSVSGQYLQELTWSSSDLVYRGGNVPTGDLPYNLRTREGIELSSGLYLYVLTATGPNGKDQVHRGKFVVIR